MESNEPTSFESFSFEEKQLIYNGLLALVKSNSGIGFCNADQGHPAYAFGRKEGKYDHATFGDSPAANRLFKMMHALSVALIEAEDGRGSEISEYVLEWGDFCRLAYDAYERAKNLSSGRCDV